MVSAPEIESFLAFFEQRLAPVEKTSSEAWWKLATSGTEETQEELVRARMEYNRLWIASFCGGRSRSSTRPSPLGRATRRR